MSRPCPAFSLHTHRKCFLTCAGSHEVVIRPSLDPARNSRRMTLAALRSALTTAMPQLDVAKVLPWIAYHKLFSIVVEPRQLQHDGLSCVCSCLCMQIDFMFDTSRKMLETAAWDRLRKPWASAMDVETGRKFYYNTRTLESRWFMPILERQTGMLQMLI